jgi:hypothetical protein
MRWYGEYSKIYRDALAHRIPLYVPPFVLLGDEGEKFLALKAQIRELNISVPESSLIYDEIRKMQKALGKPSLVFTHSFHEKSGVVLLHSQVIMDYLTIEEVLDTICDELWPIIKRHVDVPNSINRGKRKRGHKKGE